jgi:hypothetical protein
VVTARSFLLAVPGRLAQALASADVHKATALIEEEIATVVAHMTMTLPTLARSLQ